MNWRVFERWRGEMRVYGLWWLGDWEGEMRARVIGMSTIMYISMLLGLDQILGLYGSNLVGD